MTTNAEQRLERLAAAERTPVLMEVLCVYGYSYRIACHDYQDDTRTMLPIYLKSGKKKLRHYEQMGWSVNAMQCYLHRDNIAEIIG